MKIRFLKSDCTVERGGQPAALFLLGGFETETLDSSPPDARTPHKS
jgi:hypothetical protein